MGKQRQLEYPPPCPECGEEFSYSKAPYCSCLCGNFVFKEGVLSPVDKHKSRARTGNKGNQSWYSGKYGLKTWFDYEKLQGWEEPAESEE
jgi:hypothetical protein